jgi:hypothetical protein
VIITIYTTFIGKCHYPVTGAIPGRDLVQQARNRKAIGKESKQNTNLQNEQQKSNIKPLNSAIRLPAERQTVQKPTTFQHQICL